jgi:hypothetical protein
MTPDEKECPVCGETIKAVAKKCKHCGEWLDMDAPSATSSAPTPVASSGPPPAVAAPPLDGLKGAQVLDLLSTLVDKNLVVYEEDQNGQGRYRLLETVRQYAQERLAAQSVEEEQGVSGRHRDYFLVLAEQEQHRLHGPSRSRRSNGWNESTTTSALLWSGAGKRARRTRDCGFAARCSGSGTCTVT